MSLAASGRASSACRSASIVLAHNANRTVPDYLDTATGARAPSIATLPPRWMSAIRATWSVCARLFPDMRDMRAAVSAVYCG